MAGSDGKDRDRRGLMATTSPQAVRQAARAFREGLDGKARLICFAL